jgi:hypothetical protein
MQHPFEGIMAAEQQTTEARPTRRSLLGRVFGAVAVLFGAGALASAQSPVRRVTTLAYGEEGGRWPPPGYWPPVGRWPTTAALGEEGGYPWPPHVPRVPPVRRLTTLAYGEEGGVTTYAWGEEGAY